MKSAFRSMRITVLFLSRQELMKQEHVSAADSDTPFTAHNVSTYTHADASDRPLTLNP